jgi:hypothetical protein
MRRALERRFTLTEGQYGPIKRVGYVVILDTETGELTRESFCEWCDWGKWRPGLPPRRKETPERARRKWSDMPLEGGKHTPIVR